MQDSGSELRRIPLLRTLVNKVSRKGQSPVGLDATRRRALHPARRPRGTRGPPGSPPRPARRRPGGPRLLRDEASPSVWPRPGRGRRRAARSGLPCRAPRVLARLCARPRPRHRIATRPWPAGSRRQERGSRRGASPLSARTPRDSPRGSAPRWRPLARCAPPAWRSGRRGRTSPPSPRATSAFVLGPRGRWRRGRAGHELGPRERQLLGDEAAQGGAQHVGPVHAEVPQEARHVGGESLDEILWGALRPRVEGDGRESAREGGDLLEEAPPAEAHPVYQDEGRARAAYLVFYGGVLGARHGQAS